MKNTRLCAAAVFSDNMVLQQQKEICIFGTGTSGNTVTAEIDGSKAVCTIQNGHWKLFLRSHCAGGPYVLTVSDGMETIHFQNVLIGEVWLAGGQSNMELELQNSLNGRTEVANSENSQLRYYNVAKCGFEGETLEEAEKASSWKECNPATAGSMSAVAYFCAQRIQQELGVPVGIIDCYWGGTTISCWMSENQLSRSKAGQKYLDDYAARIGEKSDEETEIEMENYNRLFNEWDARVKAMREKDPDVKWEVLNAECGCCPWPPPAGKKSPYRPAGLFKTMIRHVAPYTIRGFLYYQGEEDDPRCNDYGEMMVYLIDQWRSDWDDDELPFLFVQLPMYISKNDYDTGEDNRHWCILRECQWRVSRTVKNTALAVTIDCGELDNVHPLDKKTVGTRLALQALKTVYGKSIAADGPVFAFVRKENGRLRVIFDNAQGLHFVDGESAGFEIAGSDGVYYPALARVDGETVLVSAAQVAHPEFVRYAWFSWGKVRLYNIHGLPAAPFRSSRLF